MKRINKLNMTIILCLFLFFIISILSVYSFSTYLSKELVIKQIIFYLLGGLTIFFSYKKDIKNILKYKYFIYGINVLALFLVLIFGKSINGTKAWFSIPFIGSIQPSEFMKIGIILVLASILSGEIKNGKEEIKKIFLCFIIVLIPSILTFLEPDTGAVFIYFVAFLIMMFFSGIRLRWFLIAFSFLFLILIGVLYLYYFEKELFINILGSSFFYRLDRLFDWSSFSGMQLENSIINIASSGIIGHGFNNILLYYPEGHTDFIFTSFGSGVGFGGIILFFVIMILFDFSLIKSMDKANKKVYKLIISGIIGVLAYQQIQNISMTVGILPITGVTLPFISYGGSSLLSYMILISLVISLNNIKNSSILRIFLSLV